MSEFSVNNSPLQSGLKMSAAFAVAATITLLSFALMQQLIAAKHGPRPKVEPIGPLTLYSPPKDSAVIEKTPMPKMPPPPERNLPKPEVMDADPANITPGLVTLGPIELPKSDGRNMGSGVTDRSATPLVRVEPRYPIDAARDGITGWVRLAFSIDETGSVTDIAVLAAEPANIFNREAIKALRRWKYQPNIVNGVAVKQTNMSVQLDFSIQDN